MLEFTLSLADALRFRFTISPVGEVVRLARALANPATFAPGVHTAWLDGRGPDLRRLRREHDLRPLFAVLSARSDYYPDFFTPTPTEPLGDIEAELAQIRATPFIARACSRAAGSPRSSRTSRRSSRSKTGVFSLI